MSHWVQYLVDADALAVRPAHTTQHGLPEHVHGHGLICVEAHVLCQIVNIILR